MRECACVHTCLRTCACAFVCVDVCECVRCYVKFKTSLRSYVRVCIVRTCVRVCMCSCIRVCLCMLLFTLTVYHQTFHSEQNLGISEKLTKVINNWFNIVFSYKSFVDKNSSLLPRRVFNI